MSFQIIENDITKLKADVIVSSAEHKQADYSKAGEVTAAPAFGLSAGYIIHTVIPVWNDGSHGEREALNSCYENSLALAARLSAVSAAFPLMGAGVYGFPKDEAIKIALDAIGTYLLSHEMDVSLVVPDRNDFELSSKLTGEIDKYIDNNIEPYLQCDRSGSISTEGSNGTVKKHSRSIRRMVLADAEVQAAPLAPSSSSLDHILSNAGESFQQRLFKLIDESGMDDVTVYKKANIDRKLFSRIRCKADYKPKKKTAVAFAIALHLDMPTMLDLLSRAEIAFSSSSRFDLIITYCVDNGIYDIFEINSILFKYGEPILGE